MPDAFTDLYALFSSLVTPPAPPSEPLEESALEEPLHLLVTTYGVIASVGPGQSDTYTGHSLFRYIPADHVAPLCRALILAQKTGFASCPLEWLPEPKSCPERLVYVECLILPRSPDYLACRIQRLPLADMASLSPIPAPTQPKSPAPPTTLSTTLTRLAYTLLPTPLIRIHQALEAATTPLEPATAKLAHHPHWALAMVDFSMALASSLAQEVYSSS